MHPTPTNPAPAAEPGSPPLRITWILVRTLFFGVAAVWVLIGALFLVGFATADGDASGTIRCPAGSYPASAGADRHECFTNGLRPDDGFTPDPMTDHQREEK